MSVYRGRYIHVVCTGLVAAGLAASRPAEAQTEPEPTVVEFALTSLVVAPGKDSGLPWDTNGTLPAEVRQGLVQGVAVDVARSLFNALLGTSGVGSVAARLVPWAVNGFINSTAAPDVAAVLSVDGVTRARAPRVLDQFRPTWAHARTPPISVGPETTIEIVADDMDLLQHDRIGMCTLRGMPSIDSHGYAVASSFRCHGQLWSVALRVIRRNTSDEQPAQSSPPPPSEPSPPAQ